MASRVSIPARRQAANAVSVRVCRVQNALSPNSKDEIRLPANHGPRDARSVPRRAATWRVFTNTGDGATPALHGGVTGA